MNHGQCIHWNGPSNDCCRAGVNYHEAFGPADGMFLRLPCIRFMERPAGKKGTLVLPGDEVVRVEFDRRGQQMIECPSFQAPTEEQVQASRQEALESLERHRKVMAAVKDWRLQKPPPIDRAEVLACPACNGRLHLRQSSYNGHVSGRCETAGCVHWME